MSKSEDAILNLKHRLNYIKNCSFATAKSLQWGCEDLISKKSSDILRGTTLDTYRLVLKNGKPTGIREVQRELNLSSPSVARYHLLKLEQAGLLKLENGNYVVNKVLLDNSVRINRMIIPRFLFYVVLAIAILLIGLAFLEPTIVTYGAYYFIIGTIVLFTIIFCVETAKVWRKGGL